MALVAGTLVVASVGSILLVRRAATSTAEQQLYTQVKAIADYPTQQRIVKQLTAIQYLGQYASLSVVGLNADGTFTANLPAELSGLDLDTSALVANESVAGTKGNLVYVLVPVELTTAAKHDLEPPIPYQTQAVLVATRTVEPPVNGLAYYLAVGLASLAVAAAVAIWLARRFAAPLTTAVAATGRLAAGDLEARVPVSAHDVPELGELAAAINALAESLARARAQQRQFLLTVSHDLRTPLTSIRGYAEAVADGTTDDVPGALAVIDGEARRLERLVRDLLDLAQLDARRLSLQSEHLDASAVAAEATEGFGPSAQAGLLVLTLDAQGPAPVVADAGRLRQILSNLIENALKFAASAVTVGVHADGGRVTLTVADDGPGIPADDLPHVFEPHYSADRSGRGTGLGLAIVAELASAMGGGSRARSPVGPEGGTEVEVWLPEVPFSTEEG